MSKIKAAIITAIIGTSSAAMASPTVSFNANARFSYGTPYSAPVIRDHTQYSAPVIRDYTQAPVYAMPSTRSTSWVSLASYLDLSSGRDVLRLDNNMRASALTLRANMGRAYVEKVLVRFQDGSRQVMHVDSWMTTRNPAIQLDLRGRSRIDSIIIVGESLGRASYSVLAQSETMNRPPVFEQPAPVLDVTGHYSSVHGDIYLTQRGNRVTGTYPGKEGTIEGTIYGNQLHFRWNQPAARIQDTTGQGVFTFGGGRHVEGTWGLGNAASGAEWDLNLISR
ncbi:MAG: hypothetical protein H0T46_02065 [Deltaproteobacteria bacterium]|nr:hypothetical protein [Deltaproteobacteria bacterium]